jgi:REP element-mobilizing transposase RayT
MCLPLHKDAHEKGAHEKRVHTWVRPYGENMTYDPYKHHRRSIRLKGYDYSQAGLYFVTICVQRGQCLLTEPTVQQMIELWWGKLPEKFTAVALDAFVIMPNHIHFIIVITAEHEPTTFPAHPTHVRANPRVRPTHVGAHPRVRPFARATAGQAHGSARTNASSSYDE